MRSDGQLGIEDIRTPEPQELARASDPETSQQAAVKLSGKAGTMRRNLLMVYRADHAGWGLTAEQAAAQAGYRAEDGAWKRVSDLLNAGLLKQLGSTTRPGRSGRQQRVLTITESGRRVLG